MKTCRASLPMFAACLLFAGKLHAATSVAVMPVQGVNLTEGQCDAIGLFFSNAFARDAHVAVSSPAQTKAAWTEARTSKATAERLGASEYVELSAIRLGSKVTLSGILFASDGREIFRAEASAWSIDEADAVSARLAQALIWRQPVPPPMVMMPPPGGYYAAPLPPPPAPEPPRDPSASRGSFGAKGSMLVPAASGRKFSPQVAGQFDARIGPRGHFLEFGVGAAVPIEDQYTTSSARGADLFIELGGSAYLNDGSVGLYAGGGVIPGLWIPESPDSSSDPSAMCAVYGQLGLDFTRDSRLQIYGEFRVSQHLLSVTDASTNSSYHPTVFAFQMGLGW